MTTPNLDENGWELESAEMRHAQAPSRFLIPSLQERSSLAPGQRVKLLFLLLTNESPAQIACERMWVTVRESSPKGYAGTLDSLPASSQAIRPGDQVEFGPEHVCAILASRIPNPESNGPNAGETG